MSKSWPRGSRKGSIYIGKPRACLALNDAHENGCRGRRALRLSFLLHAFLFCEAALTPIHLFRFTRGTARSRTWNVLSRAYAFSPLKCWFGSVFKRNHFSLFHGTLWSGNNLLISLFLQHNAFLTRFCNEFFKLGASVPVSSCNNLTK